MVSGNFLQSWGTLYRKSISFQKRIEVVTAAHVIFNFL
jgi:hypothetical protein